MSSRILVYGSSSAKTLQEYYDEAYKVGELIAKNNLILVNGGGKSGCMGAMNSGCHAAGGYISCVIHQKWVVDQHEFKNYNELIVTEGNDLHERKKKLVENANAIIVCPGGFGTFDEVCEILCEISVGFRRIPICLLNVNGFFDPLLEQFQRAGRDGMLYHSVESVIHHEPNAEAAVSWVISAIASVPETPRNNLIARDAPVNTSTSRLNIFEGKERSSCPHITGLLLFAAGLAIGFVISNRIRR